MKAIEILRIGFEMLKMMSEFGLRTGDWRHVGMYEEYVDMRRRGEKVDYILAQLSSKYSMSESTIKRVVKRLSGESKT